MVARDEGASFRIFSTLNGRGMDLSVVDKLKADLLAGVSGGFHMLQRNKRFALAVNQSGGQKTQPGMQLVLKICAPLPTCDP